MNLKLTGPIVPTALVVIAVLMSFGEAYALAGTFAFGACLLMAIREAIDEVEFSLVAALTLHRDIERLQKLLSDLPANSATTTSSEATNDQ